MSSELQDGPIVKPTEHQKQDTTNRPSVREARANIREQRAAEGNSNSNNQANANARSQEISRGRGR